MALGLLTALCGVLVLWSLIVWYPVQTFLLAITILIAVAYLLPPPQPMFGVYSQPGPLYALKFIVLRVLLWARAARAARGGRPGGRAAAGYGVRSFATVAEMERVQPLADHPLALDSVWVQGVASDGSWLVAGAARRPEGLLDAVLLVGVPGVGTLKLPAHPDTVVAGGREGFSGAGLSITPELPMRRWRVKYNGPLRVHQTDKLVDVNLDLTYTSEMPFFDYDTDMSPLTVARALARESWSRQLFDQLRDAHQTHYEQLGTARGTVTVAGREHALRVHGMRDHSYAGRRDWSLLHRYALHTIIAEDGTKAQIGVVSQPYNFSRIELGYVHTPGAVHALEWCDLELGYHGEQGVDPMDYGFSFGAGGRTYHVLVKVLESQTVYCGSNWEARLLERPCRYRINDVTGYGMSEWNYRHEIEGGRPGEYPLAEGQNEGQKETVKPAA